MKKRWCLLDGDYLCHRAWYTKGHLTHGDLFTGVVYGFLQDIADLEERFLPSAMIFCFDHGEGKRKKILPGYKGNRRQGMSEEDKALYVHFRNQVDQLKNEVLADIGYQNIFFEKGYEADDCIARVVNCHLATRRDVHHIIVSSDHDLYQLLGRRVSVYNPHHKDITNEDTFVEQWGVSPSQWVDVKCIAGCRTDCIPGIQGIGEKTAARYIAGKLKTGSASFQKITSSNATWVRNRELVELPFPGLPNYEVCEDEKIDQRKWRKVMEKFGIKSIPQPPNSRKGFGF
jgi:5'-3' exonuclease